jgi:hypothetical protein
MASHWVRLLQASRISASERVALRLVLPGAVVTWFVTGSRTSSLRNAGSSVLANSKARRDHGTVTDDPGVVTGIGEQALPLRVEVRPSRGPRRLLEEYQITC